MIMILQEKVSRLGASREHQLLAPDTIVRVDEKIDGSQITFGYYPEAGGLVIRSKAAQVYPTVKDDYGMFATAVASLVERQNKLRPGLTYHGEYIQKPRHNVLTYDRVPLGNIVVFDIVLEGGGFITPELMNIHAAMADLEAVQWSHAALAAVTPDFFPTSQLGGMSEGVVIKAHVFGSPEPTRRVTAKLVRPVFKEVKGDQTTRSRPNPANDNAISCANKFCTPARFHKAVQHLKERGELAGDRSDIPKLRKEVSIDLETEEKAAMSEWLYAAERKRILQAACKPITDWYDQYLTNDNAYWTDVRERP